MAPVEIVKGEPVIVKTTPFDVTPPGLITVMVTNPGFAKNVAGILAFTCVLLKYEVDTGEPFHATTEPA